MSSNWRGCFGFGWRLCWSLALKNDISRLAVFGLALCRLATPESLLQTNPTQAFATARADQNLLLLNFTSPKAEWCQSCKNLEAEVCQATDLQAYARTNFV